MRWLTQSTFHCKRVSASWRGPDALPSGHWLAVKAPLIKKCLIDIEPRVSMRAVQGKLAMVLIYHVIQDYALEGQRRQLPFGFEADFHYIDYNKLVIK